jgi:hypothetical protein
MRSATALRAQLASCDVAVFVKLALARAIAF